MRISEGDEKAFEALYRHYYGRLKPIVGKYMGDQVDADDILQQAFLKVWLNRETLPEIENIHAWIYKVAYREYLMGLRKKLSYEARLNRYSDTLHADHSQELPTDAAHLEDIRKHIGAVVSNLSPQRRMIYELSRNEGLKIAEIAEKLSLSTQTVKNVLFLVMKMIREHLVAAGYGPLTVIVLLKII
ncbi:RNA polymerase sigma-70 factor, ECF subfamily [Chitinophaga arvensicola]|uniref:RNA polymerase sigma factor n=2 Tax=Chitinophaga arvensicola TaxID=29529 RepID=A0A1I0R3W0_9BACT|nr:RNA polymerase sigma-70 factor, ECF subfamily [Chitinophaga arvensicola]